MKNKYIKDLQSGEKVQEASFVIKSIRHGKTMAGKDYIDLVLIDKTGEINGKIWENNIGNCADMKVGDVIALSGAVEEYKEKQQINITYLQTVKDFELHDFLPVTEKDLTELWEKIKNSIASIKNKHLKELLNSFYADQAIAKKIKMAPAAEYIHHAYMGGLMEHMVEMINLCETSYEQFPKVNRDLLIAGVLLHDIGKIEELAITHTISRTIGGNLLAHITLGALMVDKEISKIKNFPENLRLELLHLIVSHHGLLEFGSPVKPMMREAFILHYVDNLSAKTNTVQKVYDENQGNGDADFSEKIFVLDSRIYLK